MPKEKNESLDKKFQPTSNLDDLVRLRVRLHAEQSIKTGKISEALSCVRKAELINDSGLVIDIYNNLGTAYWKQKQFNEAINYYKKALQIGEAIFGKNSLPVAEIFSNLGIVYTSLKDYDTAEIYYQNCINLEKQVYDNELNMIKFLNNFAHIYLLKNEFEKAKKYYEIAIGKCNDLHENDKQNIIFYELLLNLGSACKELKKFDEAEYYYLLSLDYAMLHYGNTHSRYIDVLDSLVSIALKTKYPTKKNNELLEFRISKNFLLLDQDLALFLQASGGIIKASSILFEPYVAIKTYQSVQNDHEYDNTELMKKRLDFMVSAIETSNLIEDKVFLALTYKSEGDFENANAIFKNIIEQGKQENNENIVLWAQKNFNECKKILIKEKFSVVIPKISSLLYKKIKKEILDEQKENSCKKTSNEFSNLKL